MSSLFLNAQRADIKARTTAYGALTPVPCDVDLLIAATSCVDYSNLNNEKEDIDANSDASRTFRGMMSWVKNHRPPLVILKNVCDAPWDCVVDYFEHNGYSAGYLRVDTKTFYIPHTRMRVYLLAVGKKGSRIPATWKAKIGELKRPPRRRSMRSSCRRTTHASTRRARNSQMKRTRPLGIRVDGLIGDAARTGTSARVWRSS